MHNYVCFDIGNVLCHIDLNKFVNTLIVTGQKNTPEEAFNFISNIQHHQDIGLLDMTKALSTELELKSNTQLDYLKNAWLNVVFPNTEMINLLKTMKKEGLKIALLSNIGIDHANYIRTTIPELNEYIQHFSFEVGARKPTKLFFQSFLYDYPEFRDGLFVDDRLENCQAGEQYFQSFNFNLEDSKTINNQINKLKNIIYGENNHPSFF